MENKAVIINHISECVIAVFIKCAFQEKYRALLIEGEATDGELQQAFEMIYAQHVDLSGLYQTREFEMSAYINSLDNRIRTIDRFIELQLLFMAEFDIPFIPEFGLIKKYGYSLYWNPEYPDLPGFKRKLDQIKNKETKYKSTLKNKINELVELRRKQVKKEHTLLESRKSFLTTINRLQQAKFVIDKNTTTVEDLDLMILDHKEQQDSDRIQAKTKKY